MVSQTLAFARRNWGHVAPWALAVGYFFWAYDDLSLGTNALIAILFALSLDLVLGFAGIITIGQAASYGFGAYAAGIFAVHASPDPLLGLAFATVASGLFGLLCGALFLHTRELTQLMLTLAIGVILADFANQMTWLTGGDDGLNIPSITPIFGANGFDFDLYNHTGYLYCLAVLLVWFVAAWRIVRSPFGRSLDGIRQKEARMRAIGTPVWWRLVAVYGLGAAMAGTAGGLSAQTTKLVGLTALNLLASGTILVILTLGGTRRLYGAFVGGAVYTFVQDYVSAVDPYRWYYAIGGMLMVVVLFLDNGLIGVFDRAGRWVEHLLPRRPSA